MAKIERKNGVPVSVGIPQIKNRVPVSVGIPFNLLSFIDKKVEELHFKSRSDFIVEILKEKLQQN